MQSEDKAKALLARMSLALDDLSPDETIGFSNGVQWIEVATVEEIRSAARQQTVDVEIRPLEWRHDGNGSFAYCGVTDTRWVARNAEERAKAEAIRAARIRSALAAPVKGGDDNG